MFDIVHEISLADAHGHLLAVRSTFRARAAGAPLPSPFRVFMPVWTPGSYLVREYARHVEHFAAAADGARASHTKVRKNAWAVAHENARSIEISYQVYANDLSVRTNHVDATHAYWNGAATYCAAEHAPELGGEVVVRMPAAWQVVTSLSDAPSTSRPETGASPTTSVRTFVARDFDELCDAPFECAELISRDFEVLGKAHRFASPDTADAREVDWDKLARDTQTIIETEAHLLAGAPGRAGQDATLGDSAADGALPYPRYLFIWHITGRGRGGLEHRESTTLMARPGSFHTRSGYLDVLSLVAHEFFHLWNVKRLRPAGLTPYRYEEENYTRLLWWFEGATSYYDWRTLRMAGLCSGAEYLQHLADELARLEDTPGALVHSLEESSYDAWIKAYRPDENSVNSTVSYYLKGEVVCALLDLELRQRTRGRVCLDDVLRYLYQTYGKRGLPVPEDALPPAFAAVAQVSLDDCFEHWVRRAEPIDVNPVLAHAGLQFTRTPRRDAPPAALGARLRLDSGRLLVDAVLRGGAGHRAGLDVRDEIIAVAGKRVPEGRAEVPLVGLRPGDEVTVTLARDGRLLEVRLILDPPLLGESRLALHPGAAAEQRALGERWLGEAVC